MKIRVKLELDPEAVLKKRGLEQGGRAQKWLENEIIRQCEPYTPFDTGTLAHTAAPWPHPGGGYVKWNQPYAHYQYMGVVYGPNIPMVIGGEETFRSPKGQKKNSTGAPLQYDKTHDARAGSRWVERMMADKEDDILQGLADLTGGKVGKK